MGALFVVPNCAYPKWTSLVFLPNNLFMLVLFVDFYIKTYVKKPKIKNECNKNIKENDALVKENEVSVKGKENLVKRFTS